MTDKFKTSMDRIVESLEGDTPSTDIYADSIQRIADALENGSGGGELFEVVQSIPAVSGDYDLTLVDGEPTVVIENWTALPENLFVAGFDKDFKVTTTYTDSEMNQRVEVSVISANAFTENAESRINTNEPTRLSYITPDYSDTPYLVVAKPKTELDSVTNKVVYTHTDLLIDTSLSVASETKVHVEIESVDLVFTSQELNKALRLYMSVSA